MRFPALFLMALAPFLAAAQTPAKSSAPAPTKPSEIPVETFFKRPDLSVMTLSPDGKTLAALTSFKGRNNIVVVDLENRKPHVITSFEEFDVAGIFWVNDKRLLFRVVEARDVLGNTRFKGTYAIDTDGGNLRNLSDGGKAIQTGKRIVTIDPLRRTDDGSDDLIVEMDQRFEAVDVFRLDTRTGRTKENLTLDAPADTDGYVLDWNRVPRIATASDRRKGITTTYYRDDMKSPWVPLHSYPLGSGSERFVPIAFNADNQTLFVASNVGRDKAAIYTYDTKAKKLGDVILEHPMIDVWGGLRFDNTTHKLLGVGFLAERDTVIWVDPDFRKVQAQVDAALPKTINQLIRAPNNPDRLLVFSWSDTDPGRYYLLTLKPAVKMELLLPTRPEVKPGLMAERRFITYKARDGLEIPAWLTIPKDSAGKNLPLVINIHGGPWLRIYGGYPWGFNEAQFLASRGYAVLEPEPRGSSGFGRKHLTSGFKQWGRTMQDDITDGALHLVKEGIADKKRMCLYGASYGGYAALQGLAREPDLFRCGVAFVAVTDLTEYVTSNESDTSQVKADLMQNVLWPQVGDPSKDADMLVANSPTRNAKKIKAPVLLAMGQVDVRVPLEHGRRMRAAMEDAGVKHEYIVYAGEGHGWNKDENNYDWYKRVEKFLGENLK